MSATCEVIAQCLGFIGLVGTSAATGLPMWRVLAFIQANIIVMETRWEGLWMNCYRQANIRMQCKLYDSLLSLPPDLQASRGLMCTAVALSAVGLLVSLRGIRTKTSLQDHPRIQSFIVSVAGAMQIMASLAVFIPVSWTAHVIIRNFYDPMLMDAQRRELGAALYIGWVAGGFLFVSGVIFLSCHPKSESPHATCSSPMPRLYPLPPIPGSISSLPRQLHQNNHQPYPRDSGSTAYQPVAVNPAGQPMFVAPVLYNSSVPNHQQQMAEHSTGGLTLPWQTYTAIQPLQHAPNLYGYGSSRNESHSPETSCYSGMYI